MISDQLELQPKEMGIVYFDSSPKGARIMVDGQLLIDPDTEESLKTPERVLLIEGRRNFTFVLEGHKDLSGYVDVFAGVTVNIFRNMEPGKSEEGLGKPQPQIFLTVPNTGILRVYPSPDGADVYVNRRYIGKTPLIITDVPVGVASVIFRMPGMLDEETIVDIVEGTLSDTYSTMRPVLPQLQSYCQNRGEAMNKYESGSVYISSYPAGASICIDGNTVTDELGNPVMTPITVNLPLGDHEIILSLDGYFNGYEDIYIYYPGEETYVSINLYQKPPEIIQTSVGNVTISSYPEGAAIYIDGNTVTDGLGNPIITPSTITLLEGYHYIVLCIDGYFNGYEYIYIYPGAELDISINLSQKVLTTLQPYAPEGPEIPCVFPETPGQTATQGSIVLTTYPPGGSIVLDGKTVIDLDTGAPITTPVQLVITFGLHDLRFRLDGFFDEYAGVYITPAHISFIHKNFNVQ